MSESCEISSQLLADRKETKRKIVRTVMLISTSTFIVAVHVPFFSTVFDPSLQRKLHIIYIYIYMNTYIYVYLFIYLRGAGEHFEF